MLVTSKLQIFHGEPCDIWMMFNFVFQDCNFFLQELLKSETKNIIQNYFTKLLIFRIYKKS